MPTGKVKWFDDQKGFGFIIDDADAVDVFVHHTEIVSEEYFKKLNDRDIVEFEREERTKGPVAHKVKKIGT